MMTACLLAALSSASCMAENDLRLPQPDMNAGTTLMQALKNRHSAREFSDREISDGVLSTVLWAACGINRPETGGITAPSAINAQDILVYVVRSDGAYLYEPGEQALKKVSGKDLRRQVAGRQEFAAAAPVSLVLVSNHGKFGSHSQGASRMGLIDAGYVSQNICLICSALGLNTVPRMTMDTESLRKELKLDENYDFVLNSQIGYPKN